MLTISQTRRGFIVLRNMRQELAVFASEAQAQAFIANESFLDKLL